MNAWHVFGIAVVLQVTAISLIACLSMALLQRWAPLRHAAGVVALTFVLASPITAQLLPEPTWLKSLRSPAATADLMENRASLRAITELRPSPVIATTKPHLHANDPVDDVGSRSPSAAKAVRDTPAEPSKLGGRRKFLDIDWKAWSPWVCNTVGAAWLVGVLVFTCRHFIAWRPIRALVVSAGKAAIDPIVATEARLALGLNALPPVFVSDLAPMPMVVGCRRPRVVLPRALLETSTADRLRDVLIHEFAHILRRDSWIHAAQQVAGIVCWPHPGVQWLNREIARAREEVCDNFVLGRTSSVEYAQTLLDLAQACGRTKGALSLLGLFTRRWTLEQRITGILSPSRSVSTRTWPIAPLLTAVLLGTASLVVGGVRAERATDEPAHNSDTKPAPVALAIKQADPKVFPPDAQQPKRPDTPTGRLLDKLEAQNADNGVRLTDPWLRTMKEIVDLGPRAVPELIAELDATSDEAMLRCLGFILRAIGDKRAVPALIRAISKTLVPSSSDYGLTAKDDELARFARKYDMDDNNDVGDQYSFGRPIREIFASLESLTDQRFDESELFHTFRTGTDSQMHLKRLAYHRVARKWADWWEGKAPALIRDKAYWKVHLPVPPEKGAQVDGAATTYKVSERHSNWILQSIFDAKAERSLFDLDTGRTAGLPKKWRSPEAIDAHFDEILAWAASEGFDLLGTDYVDFDGRRYFALRQIGLQAWELGPDRWKKLPATIRIDALLKEGVPAKNWLLHIDKESGQLDPKATVPFLYITREGNPGVLYVGIEVQDDSLKPGGIVMGDSELDPVAFTKGRRFAFTELMESANE